MSNISKRLLMGARKFSSAGDYDDNASVTSDTSVNTADNSWMQRLRYVQLPLQHHVLSQCMMQDFGPRRLIIGRHDEKFI